MDQHTRVPPILQPRQPQPPPDPEDKGTLKKVLGPLAILGLLLAKFKGLSIAVLKFFPLLLKTGGTMVLTIWLYAMSWGWWFALGFVLLIFVHECGHLLAARKVGLKVGAPVFIPFMGAFIALKEAPRNAWIEAQVGIGGPLLGTAGGVVCWGIYYLTKNPLFAALAYSAFFLNLFNLAPIGFLDGGRIVTALSPWLWVAGAGVLTVMLISSFRDMAHFNFLLLLILLLSLPRLFSLFRKKTDEERRYYEVTREQRWTMAGLYFWLIAFLVFAMRLVKVTP